MAGPLTPWPLPTPGGVRMSPYQMTGDPFLPGSPFMPRGGATADWSGPAGATASWGDDYKPPEPFEAGYPEDTPLKARQREYSRRTRGAPLASTPSSSVETPPPAGSGGAGGYGGAGGTSAPPRAAGAPPANSAQLVNPNQLRTEANEAWTKLIDQSTAMPDTQAMQDAYRRRYEGAGGDIAMAMLLSNMGGKMGREMGPQVFKQALAAREPEKTAYGTLDYGGFTADPFKQREMEMGKLERMAQFKELQAKNATDEAERERAHREAEALRELQVRMHNDQIKMQQAGLAEQRALRLQQFEQGKWVKLKDNSDNEFLFNTTTHEIQRPGGGGAGGGLNIPKLNDSQGKAVAFGIRAAESAQQIEDLAGKYSPGSVSLKGGLENIPHVGGALGAIYNIGMGSNEQMAEQAQRNFVNAVLRRESGAVINPSEFANARQQYFPQAGDSPEVLAQKKQNRESAILGLILESGPGAQFVLAAQKAAREPRPTPSALPKTTTGRAVEDYKQRAVGGTGSY